MDQQHISLGLNITPEMRASSSRNMRFVGSIGVVESVPSARGATYASRKIRTVRGAWLHDRLR